MNQNPDYHFQASLSTTINKCDFSLISYYLGDLRLIVAILLVIFWAVCILSYWNFGVAGLERIAFPMMGFYLVVSVFFFGIPYFSLITIPTGIKAKKSLPRLVRLNRSSIVVQDAHQQPVSVCWDECVWSTSGIIGHPLNYGLRKFALLGKRRPGILITHVKKNSEFELYIPLTANQLIVWEETLRKWRSPRAHDLPLFARNLFFTITAFSLIFGLIGSALDRLMSPDLPFASSAFVAGILFGMSLCYQIRAKAFKMPTLRFPARLFLSFVHVLIVSSPIWTSPDIPYLKILIWTVIVILFVFSDEWIFRAQ